MEALSYSQLLPTILGVVGQSESATMPPFAGGSGLAMNSMLGFLAMGSMGSASPLFPEDALAISLSGM